MPESHINSNQPRDTELSEGARRLLADETLAPVKRFLAETSNTTSHTPQQSLDHITNAILQMEGRLQSERVTVDGDGPPDAHRDIKAWRLDWTAFCEVRNLTLSRLTTGTPQNPASQRERLNPEDTLFSTIKDGLMVADKSVLNLLSLHITSRLHPFLFSPQVDFRAKAFRAWSANLDNEEKKSLWLECLELERKLPGSGVRLWISKMPGDFCNSSDPALGTVDRNNTETQTSLIGRMGRWIKKAWTFVLNDGY
jgi:hypothetical protein